MRGTMTVPIWSFIPVILAVLLYAFRNPQSAILLPLVFHAAYRIRASVPLGIVDLPTTLLELLIWVAVVVSSAVYRSRIVHILRALPRSVRIATLLFLAAATVSTVIAPHPRTAWGHWKAFIVEPVAYAAVLLPLLQVQRGREAVIRALLTGGLVSAGLSLLAGALSSVPLPPLRDLQPFTAEFGRLRGIYDVPNSLALVLVPVSALAAALSFGEGDVRLRRFARFALVPILPALLWTQSLAGIVAATLGSLTGIIRLRGIRRALLPTGYCLLPVLAAILLMFLSGKLSHTFASNSPLQARRQIWAVSLALVRDHPILGTGLGTFEPAYQQKLHELLREKRALPLEWVVRDPHNLILSFWLNAGFLGLFAMGGLVISALRRALAIAHDPFPVAVAGALLALLAFGLTDVPYFKNDLSLLWWVLMSHPAVTADLSRHEKVEKTRVAPARPRHLLLSRLEGSDQRKSPPVVVANGSSEQ